MGRCGVAPISSMRLVYRPGPYEVARLSAVQGDESEHLVRRAPSAEHRAPCAEHRAPCAERRAPCAAASRRMRPTERSLSSMPCERTCSPSSEADQCVTGSPTSLGGLQASDSTRAASDSERGRPARSRVVRQPLARMFAPEALAPCFHRVHMHPNKPCDVCRRHCFRHHQHRLRPTDDPLLRLRRTQRLLEESALFCAQNERDRRTTNVRSPSDRAEVTMPRRYTTSR